MNWELEVESSPASDLAMMAGQGPSSHVPTAVRGLPPIGEFCFSDCFFLSAYRWPGLLAGGFILSRAHTAGLGVSLHISEVIPDGWIF